MSRYALSPQPEGLFDRPWRPGHPFGPGPSKFRRLGMLVLLIFFCTLIAGYIYITDTTRVRTMAENYLSSLTGGHVEVKSASLSIFEGLRLDTVRVLVDNPEAPQAHDDSTLFTAGMILIKYDPRVLLTGRLEANQIVAIDPHVHLTENVDTGRWNYQRMVRPPPPTTEPSIATKPPALPEILLRNAQVEYSEIRGGRQQSLGSLAIEGRLTPSEDDEQYLFELQSRGFASEAVGPVVSGVYSRMTGQVTARLDHFEFGRDIRSILPAEVRKWWEQHALSGRLNVPVLTYVPADPNNPASKTRFRVEMELDGVTLAAMPQEWLGPEELTLRESARRTTRMLQTLYEGGIDYTSLKGVRMLPVLNEMKSLDPVRLRRVSGRFIFTDDGIQLDHVTGRIENNLLTIDGHIGGYSPNAPADIRIASAASEHLVIPIAPTYIPSMPRPVRLIYDLFRPHGTCDVALRLYRPDGSSRPEVSGSLTIIDGNFTCEKFTYPIRRATGKITFGRDKETGFDRLDVENVRGYGIAGGPNENTLATINGSIAPLTSNMAVKMHIQCDGATSEQAIVDAMPHDVQQAISVFDANKTGDYPKFTGNFSCDVIRPAGYRTKWQVLTDIHLTDASGQFVAFPYPLEHISGDLKVSEGLVEIIKLGSKTGESSLSVDGQVTWTRPATIPSPITGLPIAAPSTAQSPPVVTPELKIVAKNVPIDAAFLSALPADRRAWLEKIGLGGRLDIDGHVCRRETATTQTVDTIASIVSHEFDIRLHDGHALPVEGAYAIEQLSGDLRLTNDQLVLTTVHGRRGTADIAGRGTISWPDSKPHVAVSANLKDLVLDAPLYALLPTAGQRAWDEVQPEGTIDVAVTYSGDTRLTPSDSPPLLDLTIQPKQLAATVKAVPYRLEDVQGTVQYSNGKVTLTDVTARHAKAKVSVSGTGVTSGETVDRKTIWDLRLAGQDVPVDNTLRKALPPALADLTTALKFDGAVSFDFSKLLVVLPAPAGQTTTPTTLGSGAVVSSALVDARSAATAEAGSQPAIGRSTKKPMTGSAADESTADVDFGVVLKTARSSMDVGVELSDIDATISLDGTVRAGRLADLTGKFDANSLQIAGRQAEDFRATLLKSAGADAMRIADMRGKLAGGEIAGEVALAFPRVGPSRYGLNLILRDADVKTIAADVSEREVKGRLNASLALEGDWSNPASRRGRGDVSVSGKEMYRIPLVLGLLQITNLALPITSPFSEAGVDYSVDGPRVTAEQITLRSKDMLMQGSGTIDFDTKKVRMSFTTDNPNWPKLPIVSDFVTVAKHELLKINVRGTLEEPKVRASSLNTFTTTIDEVLKGDAD